MVSRKSANEIERLKSEVSSEISRDAPEIATMVFGEARDQPDVVTVQNERLDQVYRDAYSREDRTWLQGEARRDPEQFLKVVERIGVQVPPAPAPAPVAGAFAKAAASGGQMIPPPQPALPPAPMAAPPAVAPSLPVAAPPTPMMGAPPPVILGPNGQPLPPGGTVGV